MEFHCQCDYDYELDQHTQSCVLKPAKNITTHIVITTTRVSPFLYYMILAAVGVAVLVGVVCVLRCCCGCCGGGKKRTTAAAVRK